MTSSDVPPLVSFIIVTYKTPALTKACIESLETHLKGKLSYETILVDNHSRDETSAWAQDYARTHPAFSYLPQQDNLGFARANNIGFALSTAPIVILLNSDTFLTDDSMLTAVHFLRESESDVFGCGCTLLNPDGTAGISYGSLPSLRTIMQELLSLRFGSLRATVPKPHTPRTRIDFPCGAFFALKKDLLKKTGGLLDEQFFMYFEETDLAARARKAGLSLWFIPEASIVHIGGASYTSSLSIARMSDYYRSWHRYAIKHTSRLESFTLKHLLILYYLILGFGMVFSGRKPTVSFVHLQAILHAWK